MADPSRVIKVALSLRTGALRQQTFSDLMLLMQHGGTQRIEAITGADQLLGAPYNVLATDPGYKAALAAFSQRPAPARVFVGKRNAGEAANLALAACAAAGREWYGFVEVTHAVSDALVCAAWAEANTRLFLTAIGQATAITAATENDLASALRDNGYFRTAWWYHPAADAFPDAAIAADRFQTPPGGETWAFARLAGVPVVDMTEAAYLNVEAKNGNTFEPFRNLSLSQNGKTAGGEWIDIIRFADWLCEEVRSEVFNVFVKQRVPYDDIGIRMVDDAMVRALERGRRRGGIMPDAVDEDDRLVPGYTTRVPREFDVSTSDKAARILRDTGFTARLRGAIHFAEIQGDLTYDRISEQA